MGVCRGAVVAWVVAGMYPLVVDRLVCLGGPHLGLASVNSSWRQKAMSWWVRWKVDRLAGNSILGF